MDAWEINQFFDELEREARRKPAPKPRSNELVPVEYRTDVLDDGTVVHVLLDELHPS